MERGDSTKLETVQRPTVILGGWTDTNETQPILSHRFLGQSVFSLPHSTYFQHLL